MKNTGTWGRLSTPSLRTRCGQDTCLFSSLVPRRRFEEKAHGMLEMREGQPHHVRVGALDRLDVERAVPLNGVGPRLVQGLPRRDVALDLRVVQGREFHDASHRLRDRKSTRLNSSHSQISYAVFCLKKKKKKKKNFTLQEKKKTKIKI